MPQKKKGCTYEMKEDNQERRNVVDVPVSGIEVLLSLGGIWEDVVAACSEDVKNGFNLAFEQNEYKFSYSVRFSNTVKKADIDHKTAEVLLCMCFHLQNSKIEVMKGGVDALRYKVSDGTRIIFRRQEDVILIDFIEPREIVYKKVKKANK